jgi:hypothetical protein
MKPSAKIPPERRSALLPERAFVIQFGERTDVVEGRLEGRVEHVLSSRATRFESLDGLIAFIANSLAAARGEPGR